MPTRLCLETRCPNPSVYRGRCAQHARTNEHHTHDPDRKHFYNSARWKNTRNRVLFEQPLCAQDGCEEISTDVDHIVAIEAGGNPWARTNLQGLCRRHHSEKTRREQQITTSQ